MNILVTTPKAEIDNARKEGEAAGVDDYWFRVFKFRPKVEPSDRIYFVEDGRITGYGVIFSCEQIDMPEGCDVTGREWGGQGDWIVKYRDWSWLDPKPDMKGFQGVRYVDRLPEAIRKAIA